jgi:hypothetical protein
LKSSQTSKSIANCKEHMIPSSSRLTFPEWTSSLTFQ